jgi:formate/nitrite transporter FocA (FNT family)
VRTFVLAVLAGAFIALGAMFATVVTANAADAPFGINRLAGGVVFSLGLVLVVVAGAELFTGNLVGIANTKTSLGWGQAVALGVLCNALVWRRVRALRREHVLPADWPAREAPCSRISSP